jgi:hypothetical protein
MKTTLPLLIFLIYILPASGQHAFFSTPNAYLGQKPPGDTPKVFAASMLIPDSGIAMGRCALTADGKEFYYTRGMHWFNSAGVGVRVFRYDGESWKGPEMLFPGYNTPTFSMDGRSLYFEGGKGDGVHSIVWVAERTGRGWSEPVVYLAKDYGLYNFMPTKSGACYVGSNAHQGDRRNFQTYDFCKMFWGGTDTSIESLGPTINTSGFDGDFYVSPDESFMILSYHEKPDYECELGITFRKKDNSWTEPLSLGPLINDGDAHRWGEYVSPDGKYLFYSRGTSEKDCHLYWVRFDMLKRKLLKEALEHT